MLTRKPCKYCGSVWHSKNKCPERENKPLKAVYKQKGTYSPFKEKNGSERPVLAYKGKSERSQAIGYADKAFSLYIRTRGSDGFENRCYTCLTKLPIEELQCGHFIHRRYLNVRWNELNCWPQCNTCNVDKHGNLEVFERKLVLNYGQAAIDGLWELANSSHKMSIQEINAITDKYKGVVF